MGKVVGILGCGWLGMAFAKTLLEHNYTVKGTTTSAEKLVNLKELGIDAYQIEVSDNSINGNLAGFLHGVEVLLINIPPGLRSDSSIDFPKRIEQILRFVHDAQINKLIFVSSTSVFADTSPPTTYSERDLPNPDKTSGQQIYQAELKVREYFHTAVIVRPGGLLGGDRHPVKYLAGKTDIANPDAPVNLTSRQALVELLLRIVVGKEIAPIIHCISEPHVSRKAYYTAAAEKHDLTAPRFKPSGNKGKKIISDT